MTVLRGEGARGSSAPGASERPVRLLLFTSTLSGGGGEKQLVRLANHLGPDFAVSVAVARGGGEYEVELDPAIPVIPVGARKIYHAWAPMRRLLIERQPDVVCSFLDHANCVALGAARSVRGAPPVVAGVQTLPRRLRPPEATIRDRVIFAAMRALYPTAAKLIALSQGVRRELVELIPRTEGRVEVIPNAGIDVSGTSAAHLRPDVPPEHEGGPVLVACGRLVPVKAFHHLIRALARVRETIPARLWILGEGPLLGELRRLAEELRVENAIWFAGFRPEPEAYMGAADAFVLSSRFEGFGNVIVESMAAGTPVIATDCPYGPGEIITDGVNGLLVPVADVDAMAAAILRVLRDEKLAARLAREGLRRADDFTAPAIAAKYGRVLRQVASDHVPGRGTSLRP